MDIMGALIGVDRLEVAHVPHDLEFLGNAVTAMHVASHARNIQRLAAIVALDDGDHFRCRICLVHQSAHPQGALQAEGDFRLHVGKFFLKELRLSQRPAELLAVKAVLARRMPAELRCTHAPQEMP